MIIQSPLVEVASMKSDTSLMAMPHPPLDESEGAVDSVVSSAPTSFLPFHRHGLGKNLNLYWLAASGIAVWFLFVHSPLLLRKRTINHLFAVHLLGAGGIYLICIHNALVTPSTFQGRGKSWHINLGRVGMILGIVGVVTGYILTWRSVDKVGLGFAIPISIGGFFQLVSQFKGYQHIQAFQRLRDVEEEATRKAATNHESAATLSSLQELQELQEQKNHHLNNHIGYMIGTFVMACGIPAVMRLLFDATAVWPYVAAIGALNLLSYVYTGHMIKKQPSTNGKNNSNDEPQETTPCVRTEGASDPHNYKSIE